MTGVLALLDALAEHGPALFLGTTIVLAFGMLLSRMQRSAAVRRRLGIWTALACGVYLAAAIVPLPRLFDGGDVALAPTLEPVPSSERAAAPVAVAVADRPVMVLPERSEHAEEGAAAAISPRPASNSPTNAPTPTTVTSTTASIDLSRALAALYLASALLLLVRHLLGSIRLRRILRGARPAGDDLRTLANGSPGVRVLIADRPVRPFCAGWLRPVIVLSPELMGTERLALCAAVLRHEAAHLRARDPLVQTLFALLALPLSIHPLFLWLRADVRFQSELLADESAAGQRRTEYARELMRLVDGAHPPLRAASTVAIFQRPSAFYRRIQMLLQPKTVSPEPLSRIRTATQAAAMLALVAVAAGAFGVPAVAQDPGRHALEAERNALRAEIHEMRQVIEAMRMQIEADATTEANQKARTPDLLEVVYGRLEEDGRFTPMPPPEGWPGAPFPGSPTMPPAANDPAPVQPPAVGVPGLSDIPILGDLFENRPTAGMTPFPAYLPGYGTQTVQPGATAEATADLTSRLLDIETEIEIARSEMETLAVRVESAVAAKSELIRAEANLRNLTRKRDIVRGLVDGEIEATKTELEWLKLAQKRSSPDERLHLDMQLKRAEGRFQALRAAR